MAERDEFGAFLIGFLIGGLTGAAAALLLAPQSGEETRVYIKERAIELGDKASNTAQSVSKDLEDYAGDARVKANELAGKAKNTVGDLTQRGQVVLEEQKAKITSAVESVTKPKDENPAA